jgi:hypothetical protein
METEGPMRIAAGLQMGRKAKAVEVDAADDEGDLSLTFLASVRSSRHNVSNEIHLVLEGNWGRPEG